MIEGVLATPMDARVVVVPKGCDRGAEGSRAEDMDLKDEAGEGRGDIPPGEMSRVGLRGGRVSVSVGSNTLGVAEFARNCLPLVLEPPQSYRPKKTPLTPRFELTDSFCMRPYDALCIGPAVSPVVRRCIS